MKFSVSSSALLKQLAAINGVVAANPIVPILENFLFKLEGNHLTVTASDLQTIMVTELDVDGQQDGSIAMPARLLLDTLRGLPDQPITFTVDKDTFATSISSAFGHYKLSGENPIDFPKIPELSRNLAIELPAHVLGQALANTLFASSTDDLRPAMTGLFVKLEPENATFVSTDGHRLVRYRRDDVKSEHGHTMIIPRKALNLLKATLPSDDTAVKAEFSTGNALFHFGNNKMICRLIDERFPDYENAIPANNPHVLTINRLELLNSLRRIAIYANKTTHQIRMKVSSDEVMISAEDLDYSNEASEQLKGDYNGEAMEIGFNAKFLIEMLNNLTSTQVSLQLSAPNRAGLLVPGEKDEQEDLLMLVMPVMLNTYA